MGKATVKKRAETLRLKHLSTIEKQVREQGFDLIAGLDEVGRGPLAGPVVAAACVLPAGFTLRGINDSKKLTHEQRISFYQELTQHREIDFGVGVVEAAEIDRVNIHNASLEAMLRAIERLKKKPSFLIVDGCHVPPIDIPSTSVVGGDLNVQAIAAASILAKVTRDVIMIGYHDLYPQYGFYDHKGYGTKRHLEALKMWGPTPIHRMSFRKGGKNDEKHDSIQSCSE